MNPIIITKLTNEYVEGAIEVLRDSFFAGENVCNCVGILTDSPPVAVDSSYKCTEATLELEALCLDVQKDDVSLVAVDRESNQVLGVAFNKIQVRI